MARLMKDSGIEWIGEIPETWQLLRMKSCIEQRDSGAWGDEATGEEGDTICLRIADFDYARFRFKDTALEDLTIRHYDLDIVRRLLLQENDILIEKSGGGEKTPVGRTVLFDKTYPALYANFMDRLRCASFVYPPFMQYLFVTFYKNDYTRNYIKQTTGIQNLDLTSMLSNEKVAMPLLPEQQRIAAFLDRKCAEIDAVIEKTKATIEEYKKLKQAVITEAVTKGIRGDRPMKDSGIEWIGEIPEEWEVTPLKYLITDYKAGPFGSSLITDKLNSTGNILVYTPEHVAKKTAELEFNLYLPDERQEELQQFIVTPGDIIFPIVGSLGRSMLVNDDMPMGIINQRLAKFRLSSHELLIDYFMWLFSKSSFYSTYIDLNCRGSIIVNLTKQIINDMPVPHPVSLEEQEGICTYLDEKCAALDTLIAKKTALLTELETYKKSLIYEYVTGKKEVGQ